MDYENHTDANPYERHQAYQDQYLVLQQKQDEASMAPLTDHETKQMEFFLDNGLLVLAQQIAQEQKDLHELEKLKSRATNAANDLPANELSPNEVVRRDYSDVPDAMDPPDSAEQARHHAEENNTMHCDENGVC